MARRRLFKGTSQKRGLPPGTLVHIGETRAEQPRITVIDYDAAEIEERQIERVEECRPFRDKPTVTWINVDGLHDVELIQSLGDQYGLHPLVLEDILNTEQRPKVEDFGDYLYVVLKMIRCDDRGGVDVEQVSVVIGPRFVLSFQERPGDVFEAIRDRIRSAKGRIRSMGADYLAYSLIDAVVDGYFVVLEALGGHIESLEDRLVASAEPETLEKLHAIKREVLFIRKSVWPLRELAGSIEKTESPLIGEGTNMYFRDIYDHTIQVMDTMETFRDMLAAMRDTYMTNLSNRMNEVMKVLTVIATIFIPLTFIAGIYGMNFQKMPELGWKYGYPAVWVVMIALAVVMIVLFRRKKWI